MIPAIIDTDPGVDDALALFYALGSDVFEICGLTTVFGNVTVDTATTNALWLCEAVDRKDIPVFRGADRPLSGRLHEPATIAHGPFGFGHLSQRQAIGTARSTDAADFLIEAVRERPQQIDVFALGPLTNIAQAMTRSRDFARNLRHLYVMGGAFWVPGNVTPSAESNIYNDPLAAEIVATLDSKVTFIGLDVTNRILLTRSDIAGLLPVADSLSQFLQSSTDFYLTFYENKGSVEGAGLHDPTTLIAAAHPTLFSLRKGRVAVDVREPAGRTRLTEGTGNTHVVYEADKEAVRSEFLSKVNILLRRLSSS